MVSCQSSGVITKEFDFVLERPNSSVAVIEIKALERVSSADFKGTSEPDKG